MFDLEHAIVEWRKQMLAAGIQTPVPLEELETHLREDIDRLVRQGSEREQAFKTAEKQIGQSRELKKEFKRAIEPIETRLVKLLGIGCGSAAFLFSLWILPFLFHHEVGWTAKLIGLAAFLTTVFSRRYSSKVLPIIRNHTMRVALGFVSCVGCVIWIQLFIANFVPYIMVHPGRERPVGQLIALFLWGWSIMAVLASIGSGLEEAARKSAAN